jgi:hypothetical protein
MRRVRRFRRRRFFLPHPSRALLRLRVAAWFRLEARGLA